MCLLVVFFLEDLPFSLFPTDVSFEMDFHTRCSLSQCYLIGRNFEGCSNVPRVISSEDMSAESKYLAAHLKGKLRAQKVLRTDL